MLVKVIPNLIWVDSHEKRECGLSPTLFLQSIEHWAEEQSSFVIDLGHNDTVWSFPYDSVTTTVSDSPREGSFDAGPSAIYYHMEIASTGYREKRRIYEFWIKPDGSSGWIKRNDTDNPPDFFWRPQSVGDLADKSNWQSRQLDNPPANPHVDPQVVFDIYRKSIQ